MIKLLLLFPLLLALVSCNQFDNKTTTELEKKSKEIAELKQQITDIQRSQNDLSWKQFEDNYFLGKKHPQAVVFTPSAKGYQPIYTEAGNLLVSLVNIKKYANGYKVTFDIGNPTLATFSGVTILVAYGNEYKVGQEIDDWTKSLRQVDTLLNKTISPGIWSRVNIIIAPAKEEDLGYIKFSLLSSKLSLQKDYRAIEE